MGIGRKVQVRSLTKVEPGTSPVEGGEVEYAASGHVGGQYFKTVVENRQTKKNDTGQAEQQQTEIYSWIKSKTTTIQIDFHTTTKTTAGFKGQKTA